MRSVLALAVGLLAAFGVVASLDYFTHEPYNPRFREFPKIVAAHVILGTLYLAFAPFQFVEAIRRRALGYHRWMGRVLVVIGAGVGATAAFIAIVIPFSGWSERVIVGGFAIAFLMALGQSVRHIRARNVARHREWMIRSFAIGLGIASMRVIFLIATGGGEPTREEAEFLSILSFTLAFVLHGAIAEAWIRTGRRIRRTP